MIDDAFSPNMTYWQSLRIVARGLIQSPLRSADWDDFKAAVSDMLYYGGAPIIRLLMLVLLPISAPLLTLVVQAERRKIAMQKEQARKRFIESRKPAAQQAAAQEGGA